MLKTQYINRYGFEMNTNRNMRELRTKAGRVYAALEQLEAANAVLHPLISEPLAPKIPEWFPEVIHQKIWNIRKKLETELTRLDQKIEKAANGANRANGSTMYPELTNEELSGLETEIEYLIKDAKLLQSDDCPAFTQVEFENAVEVGNAAVVHLLLHGSTIDPSADDHNSIKLASQEGYLDVVKVLLADTRLSPDKPDPSADDNYAIRWASQNGHVEVVKVLLADSRVDPSANNNYAIREASAYGQTDVVKVLLADPRVDPSVINNWPIRIASHYGRTDVVKLLLADPRVDPLELNNEAIITASEEGNLDVVMLLLERRDVIAKGLSREDIDSGKTKEIRKLLREKFKVVGGRRTTRRSTQRTTRRHKKRC